MGARLAKNATWKAATTEPLPSRDVRRRNIAARATPDAIIRRAGRHLSLVQKFRSLPYCCCCFVFLSDSGWKMQLRFQCASILAAMPISV